MTDTAHHPGEQAPPNHNWMAEELKRQSGWDDWKIVRFFRFIGSIGKTKPQPKPAAEQPTTHIGEIVTGTQLAQHQQTEPPKVSPKSEPFIPSRELPPLTAEEQQKVEEARRNLQDVNLFPKRFKPDDASPAEAPAVLSQDTPIYRRHTSQ